MTGTRRLFAIFVGLAAVLVPTAAHAQSVEDPGKIVEFFRPSGIIMALVAIALTILVLRFINRTTERFSQRFAERRLFIQQTNSILRFIIYLIAIVLVVGSVIRLEKGALLALGGTVAVTVGLALQDLAKSVIGGITVLFDRPFQVGDRVTIGDLYGEITAIGLRSVRMTTLDDSVVTIPNNRFLNEVVVSGNAGALDMMIVMDFYVAQDADIPKAKRIVTEALRTSRFVYLEKPVVVLVNDLMHQSYLCTRLRGKAYVLDVRYEKAFETDVTERVKQAFHAADVHAPRVMEASWSGGNHREDEPPRQRGTRD
jgi:small-conductance mechanosensitive channel